MLFLLFHLGPDRYALGTTQVVEVLPRVVCKAIPGAPLEVSGLFDYHGAPVPLVDLVALSSGTPADSRMSTRIILVHYPDETGEEHLLGLLAEKTTEIIRREEKDWVDSGVALENVPYLGPVTKDARGIIQRIEINQLLSDSVRELLFREPIGADASVGVPA